MRGLTAVPARRRGGGDGWGGYFEEVAESQKKTTGAPR